jgi:hypothetical protein
MPASSSVTLRRAAGHCCSLLDPCRSGPQVKGEPGYPVPLVVAVGLPVTVPLPVPLVVGPEEVEPCVPGLQRRPRVLDAIPCSDVVLADGDIGGVGHVQPDFPVCFFGKLGGERVLEEQILSV